MPSARSFLLLLGLCVSQVSGEDAPPNVVVFLTDDQGWGDLSLNGNVNLKTPRIDSLARDGVRFERFFVCPVCSPTRAEFLTGRYHARGGVYSTSAGGERLDLDEITIADTFRRAGYATGAFGKWHNGMQYPYHPNGRGFEEFYGFCSGHWGDYFDSPILELNGAIVAGQGYLVDDCTRRAMEFIEQQAGAKRPFFAYLPYNTPHSPMQVPDRFWERFAERDLTMRHRDPGREKVPFTRAALAMCENIDWNVGRLLDKLDELGIAGNTIVVFFHDNGPNSYRWNGGMKGRKGSTDEGGVRSPLLIRWPDALPAGRVVSPIAGAIDLHPTLADLAGIPTANKLPFDGVSLAPLLRGPRDWPDRILIHQWRDKISARSQDFRLDDQGRLFDLRSDPGQRNDVSARHPGVTRDLQAVVDAWKEEIAGYDEDERPFLIGHPGFPWTQIPARDGKPHGGLERSNRFPNDSFFRNWKQVGEDFITWDVEVAESGTFEVEIWYAARKEDAGAVLELSLNGQSVRGSVTEPNEVPLAGAEDDRIERMESYVKDWKPMRLGRITLEAGPGTLTLRAIRKPGPEVMEFRLMMLERVDDSRY